MNALFRLPLHALQEDLRAFYRFEERVQNRVRWCTLVLGVLGGASWRFCKLVRLAPFEPAEEDDEVESYWIYARLALQLELEAAEQEIVNITQEIATLTSVPESESDDEAL